MVQPYNIDNSKKNEVRAMFNNIARSYDFLNHFLSLGIDIVWRRRVICELNKYTPKTILDMATGTGDLAIMAIKTGAKKIVGIDLSNEMIDVGIEKVKQRNLEEKIEMVVGDAENIDQPSTSFDAAIVAFGVRNFEDLNKGLLEMNRILKVGHPLIVLEFSKPVIFPVKQFYHFYSFKLLPFIGKIISKDSRAYEYLPESIQEFPCGDAFIERMQCCNFVHCKQIPLSFRIATIYIGHKQ